MRFSKEEKQMGPYKKAYIKQADHYLELSQSMLFKRIITIIVCFLSLWKSIGKFLNYFLVAYSIPGSWTLLRQRSNQYGSRIRFHYFLVTKSYFARLRHTFSPVKTHITRISTSGIGRGKLSKPTQVTSLSPKRRDPLRFRYQACDSNILAKDIRPKKEKNQSQAVIERFLRGRFRRSYYTKCSLTLSLPHVTYVWHSSFERSVSTYV